MPTADRTTIKATITELVAKLRDELVADPPTAAAPFRGVSIGPAEGTEHPRPFLTIALQRARPIGVTDDDRLFEVSLTFTLFVDVAGGDAHAVLLDAIGAVEDYFDSIRDVGVLEGAAGFEDRVWSFTYPKTTTGARLAWASATNAVVVKVQRAQNREPAT